MPTRITPQVCIDINQSYTANQASIIGPIIGSVVITNVEFNGNTATIPLLQAGTYDGTTFTAVTTLVNGLNNAGAPINTTTTINQAPTTINDYSATAITAGQYLRYTSGTNTTARFRVYVAASGAVGGFTVNTTPA